MNININSGTEQNCVGRTIPTQPDTIKPQVLCTFEVPSNCKGACEMDPAAMRRFME